MQVSYATNTVKLAMVVSQARDHIATGHGLSFLNKNILNMTVQHNQGFTVLVYAMMNRDRRPPAFFGVRLKDPAIRDGDDELTGRTSYIDTLVYIITTSSIHTMAAMKVGDDFSRRRYIRWVNEFFIGAVIDLAIGFQEAAVGATRHSHCQADNNCQRES